MYRVDYSKEALRQIAELKKSAPHAYKKFIAIDLELEEHPTTGTGHPKPLGGDRKGQWSRRITDKHRLVYSIDEEKIMVLVLSASSHYGDK